MNRQERRKLEKDMGLFKHYKTLSWKERWERIRGNQDNGKTLMREARIRAAVTKQEQEEERMNNLVSRRAQQIADKKGVPFADAVEEAQAWFEKYKK